MAQVNMPEKKDSMGQGMQLFQMAKSIYDIKNGSPSAPGAQTPGTEESGTQTTAIQRRLKAGSTV